MFKHFSTEYSIKKSYSWFIYYVRLRLIVEFEPRHDKTINGFATSMDPDQPAHPNINKIEAAVRNWNVVKHKPDGITVLGGLLNNTALTEEMFCPAFDVSIDRLQETFETNLFASINTTQIVAKKMIVAKKQD
jgi:NAD(P)-dependent dehydrogenase (short-subunit alcohol dehydrogenase family)